MFRAPTRHRPKLSRGGGQTVARPPAETPVAGCSEWGRWDSTRGDAPLSLDGGTRRTESRSARYRSARLRMPSSIARDSNADLVGAGLPTAAYLARARCKWVRTVVGAMKSRLPTASLLSV